MQTFKVFDGQEYLLNDTQAENAKKAWAKGGVILMSNGDMISTKSIAKIGSLDKVKSWGGYVLRNDGRSFVRDGEVVYLNGNDDIEEMDDPKYKTMQPINIKQLS